MMLQRGIPDRGARARGLDRLADHLDLPRIPHGGL
jgi:hypothetical protein